MGNFKGIILVVFIAICRVILGICLGVFVLFGTFLGCFPAIFVRNLYGVFLFYFGAFFRYTRAKQLSFGLGRKASEAISFIYSRIPKAVLWFSLGETVFYFFANSEKKVSRNSLILA